MVVRTVVNIKAKNRREAEKKARAMFQGNLTVNTITTDGLKTYNVTVKSRKRRSRKTIQRERKRKKR